VDPGIRVSLEADPGIRVTLKADPGIRATLNADPRIRVHRHCQAKKKLVRNTVRNRQNPHSIFKIKSEFVDFLRLLLKDIRDKIYSILC
jgi:hypothetical protein